MKADIRLVAVDIDGTFVHSDYTYDRQRFLRIFRKMQKAGCRFVAASGNQYYQLRDLFGDCGDQLAYVAENGALVMDRQELIFAADMPGETRERILDICQEYPEISNVMCGLHSAYCQRGSVSREFFALTARYYHRLKWVDDLRRVEDQILKFAPTVPEEKTEYYFRMFQERLKGKAEATASGHGSIDLILPGCHKASGLRRLVRRWGISPDQCAAFGDGGNDVEMLAYCRYSYAMANASRRAKQAARFVCPSNEEDGVLATLEQLFPGATS